MKRERWAKSSRTASALAVLGLILTSVFMVLLVNSSALVSTLNPLNYGGTKNGPGPTGALVVKLNSNQNQSDALGLPSPGLSPLRGKAFTVKQVNPGDTPKEVLVTNREGVAAAELVPGIYAVNILDEALNITTRVPITPGNETTLRVQIVGNAYPLIYSEEWDVVPTATAVQSTMFVEVSSPIAVAVPGQDVILNVRGGAPGVGHLVKATVVGGRSTSLTQWLQLSTSDAVNPVNASSILLTTWTYSSSFTVSRMPQVAGANA